MGQHQIFFRKMTPDDAEAVADLDARNFSDDDSWDSDYFFFRAQDDQSVYIVGELDGKIIACAGIAFFQDAAEIETFAVDKEFRRLGIGTKLFKKIFAASKIHNAGMIFLEVRISNEVAIEFYKSLGFNMVDRIENFYGNEDAFVMMLETN